ncbi:lysosomal Pro-X carboxypeptidase-like [Oppia nitens]|uniref:lysosomal Pro-X carboxypeptidase-like n=1 Tax=Oppia nitens TaxID=1686743 RepID=UPI0023DBF530|nr:lysosomal Pro-X carboxypeptidase-like [Oppia nitens]
MKSNFLINTLFPLICIIIIISSSIKGSFSLRPAIKNYQNFNNNNNNNYADNYTPIPANFSIKWYDQKLDHFNYVETQRFKQRYIVSTDHWCDGCPIFFYAGNEGDIFMFANNTGFMWENARRFRAMVLFAEHRYYGKSIPFGKLDRNLQHLGYLTTEQALADFAELLEFINDTEPKAANSPVVTFGGSYGGMLAAWFRMKYPHLTVGALAASAPILQFPGIYDCNGYFDIVSKDFKDYSVNCYESIRKSWPAVRRLLDTVDGRKWLSKTFVMCKPLEETQKEDFVSWLSNTWESLAMIDYPNPASFLQPLPAYPIREVCKLLTDPTKTDRLLLEDIYRGASIYYNYTGKTKCNDISLQAQDLGTDAWNFQACTEMVLPVCANGQTDMFWDRPWNLTEFSDGCRKTYGVPSDKEKAIILFGGKHIGAATNIIFSQGSRDPWSVGGVLKTVAPSLPAILIPNACHHEDLRSEGPNDPPELKAARNQEIQIIGDWIKQHYRQIDPNLYRQWVHNFNGDLVTDI